MHVAFGRVRRKTSPAYPGKAFIGFIPLILILI